MKSGFPCYCNNTSTAYQIHMDFGSCWCIIARARKPQFHWARCCRGRVYHGGQVLPHLRYYLRVRVPWHVYTICNCPNAMLANQFSEPTHNHINCTCSQNSALQTVFWRENLTKYQNRIQNKIWCIWCINGLDHNKHFSTSLCRESNLDHVVSSQQLSH